MAYTGKKPGNVNTDFLEAGGELANHDLVTVDSSGNITTGIARNFPFYKADGSSDTITITNNTVPFFKADGTSDTIGIS